MISAEKMRATRPGPDYHFPKPGERPLRFGGSSVGEPWWALGEITQRALKPHGYEVEVLSESGSSQNPRWMADGRVDLGATNPDGASWAYRGERLYEGEGARDNLRAIATVNRPSWVAVAVTHESGITDLAQIKERRLPVRLFANRPWAGVGLVANHILAYYGVTREEIVSYGGRDLQAPGVSPFIRQHDVDVMIGNLYISNSPVGRRWLDASVLLNLRFLPLPDDLIARLCDEFGYERGFIPHGYLRGVEEDIPTISHPHLIVYTRDDAPDDFVRLLAESYDRQRRYFRETHVSFSYDPENVALHAQIPLHPAALAYYREQGYPTP